MPEEQSSYYLEFPEEDERLILPSDIENLKKKRRSNSGLGNFFKYLKWAFFIAVGLYLYFNFNVVKGYFFEVLKQHPSVYSFYLFMEEQISRATVFGLFSLSVLSSLFFLMLPGEALFIYYLQNSDYFFVFLILIMTIGNVGGMVVNYLFGRVLGERVLKWIFKEKKFWDYKDKIDRVGGYILFFGNILPGPVELLAVFFGGFRFGFKRYIYLCFMGRLIKYLLLFLAFYLFWDKIVFWYDIVVTSFLNFKSLVVWF